MLMLTVDVALPTQGAVRRIEVTLHPGYGTEAETASRLLELAIGGAEWPLVLDHWGNLVRFPKGHVRQFYVRDGSA